MGYFRIADNFYDNPIVVDLPNAAIGLWAKAGSWCVKHDTNGYISKKQTRLLKGTQAQCKCLVQAGLWEEAPDGFKFKNWRKTQDGDYRKNIRKSVRAAVMKRDNHQCVWCGTTENLSLDHIIPYRLDGADTVENLRVLCMPCNQSREKETDNNALV